MPRYAPAIEFPRYSYVPGHGFPHPVNDPAGHMYAARHTVEHAADEPPIPAAALTAIPGWLHALDLFNAGFYWEAHEAWEGFWLALGRTTPKARFVQGLIHLAAACVKIREGKPLGGTRHTRRARELLGDMLGDLGAAHAGDALGLDPRSISAVVAELESHVPACWHTSRTQVVRILAATLRLAEDGPRPRP